MKNQWTVAIFVTIFYLSTSLARRPAGPPPVGNNLWNLRVYRIEANNQSQSNNNSVQQLVLTANRSRSRLGNEDSKSTIRVTTSVWNDDPSQKWRLDASDVYESYALHLTSNENFQLEYFDNSSPFASFMSWGFGYNRYWYFIDAGNGYYMIKNHYNRVCLESNGLDMPVSAEKCDNSIPQQWKLVFLDDPIQ